MDMSIIFQLSSQINERGEQGNRKVAELILQTPNLFEEIIKNLNTNNPALLGDCVEVCTMLAEKDPDFVTPYAENFIPLIYHKKSRVRWEAVHALALLSPKVPEVIFQSWDYLAQLFLEDKSVIVRDYIVVCAGNLASCGEPYTARIYPFLIEALSAYKTHLAKLALEGFIKAMLYLTDHLDELDEIADLYIQHPKPTIKKAARNLKKTLTAYKNLE
jgi:hypothetical protein